MILYFLGSDLQAKAGLLIQFLVTAWGGAVLKKLSRNSKSSNDSVLIRE